MKVIGFTGTQRGMAAAQRTKLQDILGAERQGNFGFHHGDCIGADSEAHDVAERLGAYIVVHPPKNPSKRANRKGDILCPVKPYLRRNHDIVNACDVLIAAPARCVEVMRSGTWATVRYARKQHKPVVILWPQGPG